MQPVKLAEGREAEILAWGEGRVLRLYRDPAAGARADREMRALAAVRSVLALVPIPYERIEWQGRPGIVMERVPGRDALAEINRRPWRVTELAALSGRMHADLHAIRAPEDLPELRAALGERIAQDAAIPDRLRAAALAVLARLPDGTALCHGDFQIANVLLGPRGPVVIDWANAARGDPAADFARTALMIRYGSLPPGTPARIRWGRRLGLALFGRAYRRGYLARRDGASPRLRSWGLVRAVERLADGIPEERAGLLQEAERLLDAQARGDHS